MRKNKLQALLAFDAEIRSELPEGCRLIGIDEVGRGSLIGPVVAAAVIVPEDLSDEAKALLAPLDDSKKLLPNVRAELYQHIQMFCQVGIGEASQAEVETLNVYHASLLAAYRAYEALGPAEGEELVLLDGKAVMSMLPKASQRAIVKGDGKSAAIAAASVIAKHHRDQWVIEMASQYPGYGWDTNMGYGTPEHLDGLSRLGRTPLHRGGFKAVREAQLALPLGNF